MTYWQYIKKNKLWLYLAFVGVATLFSLYWITYQENYVGDLILTWTFIFVMGAMFFIGNWIAYKKK